MIIVDELLQITYYPDSTKSFQFSDEFTLPLINTHAK